MAKSANLIVKSNSLTEARYKFTIWETRVFAKMVTMINKDDEEFTTYSMDIKELMNFYGTKAHNDYERIRKVPESLLKKIIKIPYTNEKGEKRLFKTTLIAGSDEPADSTLKKGNTTLELTFHPNLKTHLLGLKKKFLTYDIRNTLRISSSNSIHVYELLKQYETIGKRTFELKELKEVLGLEDKYQKYSHFKAKILEKAKEHLAMYCDICFIYQSESRGKGKGVTHIIFLIHANTPQESNKKDSNQFEILPEKTDSAIDNKVIIELVEIGIAETSAYSLYQQGFDVINDKRIKAKVIKRLNDDFQKYLEEKLALLKQNKKTNNPAGYLTSALRMDWQSPTVVEAVKTDKRKKTIQNGRKRKVQLELEIERLREESSDKTFEKCLSLIKSEKDCMDKVFDIATEKAGSLARRLLPEKTKAMEVFKERQMGYAMLLSAFIASYPEAFEKTNDSYDVKIKKLESELAEYRFF